MAKWRGKHEGRLSKHNVAPAEESVRVQTQLLRAVGIVGFDTCHRQNCTVNAVYGINSPFPPALA
jgi:hypothetical protein